MTAFKVQKRHIRQNRITLFTIPCTFLVMGGSEHDMLLGYIVAVAIPKLIHCLKYLKLHSSNKLKWGELLIIFPTLLY